MSMVQEIEQAIEKLPCEEILRLTDWLSARYSDLWGRQIEDDISAGLLDDLAAEAVAEHRSGFLRENFGEKGGPLNCRQC